MRCQLCGFEFDETQMTCHASCAFNKYCQIICCPNCGHQTVDESKSRLVQAFRRIFKRSAPESSGSGSCRLSDLRPGQSATVTAVDISNANRLEQLITFGIAPGSRITLEQQRPTAVIWVGLTQLAVEQEVAECIRVTLPQRGQ
jgi:Fe2+ transport system protein FeoA